jgi:SET and MYND domain-containing protein 4
VIGRGFFPTMALLNHSCDANTTRVFHLDTQVVRAARPIKKGDQIFAGYGPDYGGMERVQRQKVLLGKFFFRCLCEACENSWPLATATLGVVPEFLKQQPHLQLLKEVCAEKSQSKSD